MADPGLLLAAHGVDGGPANAMTIGWATFGVIWGLPDLLGDGAAVAHTYGLIEVHREFTVNVPTHAIEEEVSYCGTSSGREHDKFSETGLTPLRSRVVNAPTVGECSVTFECKVVHCNDVIPAEPGRSGARVVLPAGRLSIDSTSARFWRRPSTRRPRTPRPPDRRLQSRASVGRAGASTSAPQLVAASASAGLPRGALGAAGDRLGDDGRNPCASTMHGVVADGAHDADGEVRLAAEGVAEDVVREVVAEHVTLRVEGDVAHLTDPPALGGDDLGADHGGAGGTRTDAELDSAQRHYGRLVVDEGHVGAEERYVLRQDGLGWLPSPAVCSG